MGVGFFFCADGVVSERVRLQLSIRRYQRESSLDILGTLGINKRYRTELKTLQPSTRSCSQSKSIRYRRFVSPERGGFWCCWWWRWCRWGGGVSNSVAMVTAVTGGDYLRPRAKFDRRHYHHHDDASSKRLHIKLKTTLTHTHTHTHRASNRPTTTPLLGIFLVFLAFFFGGTLPCSACLRWPTHPGPLTSLRQSIAERATCLPTLCVCVCVCVCTCVFL